MSWFQGLKQCINNCITHVIGDKASPATAGVCKYVRVRISVRVSAVKIASSTFLLYSIFPYRS